MPRVAIPTRSDYGWGTMPIALRRRGHYDVSECSSCDNYARGRRGWGPYPLAGPWLTARRNPSSYNNSEYSTCDDRRRGRWRRGYGRRGHRRHRRSSSTRDSDSDSTCSGSESQYPARRHRRRSSRGRTIGRDGSYDVSDCSTCDDRERGRRGRGRRRLARKITSVL